MKILKKISALAFAAIFFLAACKKDDYKAPTQDNPGDPQPQAQTFKVKMTDGPADYEALDIKIAGVDAYLEGKGWVALDNRAHSFDVLELNNGTETEIAFDNDAEIGAYTRLRVKFDSDATLTVNANALIDIGGGIFTDNRFALVWDGTQEIEVTINEEVTADAGAEVLLDFDAAQSVRSVRNDADKFFIKPAIREVQNTRTGVRGEVEGTINAAITLSDGQNTFTTFINAEGQFMMRGMKPGVYKLVIQPAKRAIGEIQPKPREIEGVVIVEGEIKQMGQIAL